MAGVSLRELPKSARAAWLALRDARQVLADTGHYIHDGDPDLVVREIQAMLDRLGAPSGP